MLAGADAASAASVSPATLTWAAVVTGTKGGQKVVTLTNTGTTTININSISFSGSNPGDFTVFSQTCGATLAGGASCTANIIFGPTATGTRTATLNFNDSDSNSPQTIALSGLGTSGVVAASPATIAFGSTAVGTTSASQSVTLSNGTTSPLSISSVAVTGTNASDFVISGNTCGASLSVGASCTTTLAFKPGATGTRTANLSFTDSASGSPQVVALSGVGGVTPATATASPSSLTFAATSLGTSSPAQSVTLANGAGASITISSVSVTGANASDFAISSTTCGSGLAIAGTCTASIVFKPSAAGTRTASLSFVDSATNSPQVVSLSGAGVVPTSTASASPATLTFVSTSVGTSSAAQSVTLANGAGASITISSVSVTGANASDFAISSTTCGTSLAISGTCTANIIFQPSAAGTRTASLSFVDSATNSPQIVSLSGVGSSTGASAASPSSLTWAAVAAGTKSGQKTVTLTNGNVAAINISSISFSGTNPGDFTVFSKTCGTSLAPATSCTANILFGPTATGTRTAILNFNDTDSNSPQTILLSGLGTSGVVAASPASASFGGSLPGASTAPISITLSNGNTSAITIGGISVTGANPSDFVLSGTTCGATLGVAGTCSASVYFKPTASGARSANLSFTDSATSSPQAVALSGFGGTILAVSPQNPTVAADGTVHFTATVPSTWTATCGLIGSDGTFTAPAASTTCNVLATATDGSGQTAGTTVTVTPGSATITPGVVNLHALNTQTFTANQTVTWSASCGTMSASGVFTAPSTAATCTITATSSSGLKATATAQVDVANYTARKGGGGQIGAQANELALTPSNVNANTFGLAWTGAVDGVVSAQPLYMNALMVNGAPHNVVFFATANDSVYAFDGDTGAQLWQVSLIPPGATAVVSSTVGFTSTTQIGILGTPVIDPATNTMYVVAETSEQNATYFPHRLHALDLATGAEKFSGPVLVNDPQMAPVHKLQRTGLTLANGNVYVGIGSMQDMQPYHGFVFAFNAQTLAQEAVWNSTPTGSEGGIWMGSSAPAVDDQGNLYVNTGNGDLDGTANFGEATVKLSPGLQVLDYFAPYNFATYNASDVDLGSGAVMVVPDQAGSHPHALIVCGKPTPVYVLDRDNMGQLGATSDNILQRLDNQVGAYSTATKSVQACFTGPAMWGQNVYFGGKYDVLKMFTLDPNTGMLSSTPASQGTLAYGYPGTDPVVSSNGASNGIVWTIDTKTNALIASDATNVANTLFTGILSGGAIRWTVPTVVNGHVYVGEQGKVFGFQLK